MSFATLQQRVNTTALKRLGSGSALTLGGVPVAGDYLAPGLQVDLGGASAMGCQHTLTLSSTDVPVGVLGLLVQANGASFTVGQARPDGFGLTVLELDPLL